MTAIAPNPTQPTILTEPSTLAAVLATMAQEVAFHLYEKRPAVAVVIHDYGINHQLRQRGIAIAPEEKIVGFDQNLLTQVAHKIHVTGTFFSPARSYPPLRAWNGIVGLETAWDKECSFAAQFVATEARPYVPNFEDTLALGVSALLQTRSADDWHKARLARLATHLAEDSEAEEVPRELFVGMMDDPEWQDATGRPLVARARELLGVD